VKLGDVLNPNLHESTRVVETSHNLAGVHSAIFKVIGGGPSDRLQVVIKPVTSRRHEDLRKQTCIQPHGERNCWICERCVGREIYLVLMNTGSKLTERQLYR
jgi:hypothetical protein